MGNSEVGHLNIGAGRVVYQDIVSINLAFQNNQVVKNPALVEAAKRPAKKIHLLGILTIVIKYLVSNNLSFNGFVGDCKNLVCKNLVSKFRHHYNPAALR